MKTINAFSVAVGMCLLLIGPTPTAARPDTTARGYDRPPGGGVQRGHDRVSSNRHHNRRAIIRVPGDFETIGAAIEGAPDRATIFIRPGAHVLLETLRVDGKRLRIMGSRVARTELISPSLDVGIFHYTNGGGGELKNLHLIGGAYGVGANPGERRASALPSALKVENLSISGGFRGVYGAFSSLSMKNVSVHHTKWNGVSLTYLAQDTTLTDMQIYESLAVGLWIDNSGPGDVTIGGHFHHNAFAGVQVSGNNGDVHFLFTVADNNGLFGVLLIDVSAQMALSSLSDQRDAPPVHSPPGPNDVCEGAGLAVTGGSVVFVSGTLFRDNCLGLGTVDSTVTVNNSSFNSTDLQLGESIAVFNSALLPQLFGAPLDQGGGANVCGYLLGSPGEIQVPCGEFIEGPPQPPEMVGGLE